MKIVVATEETRKSFYPTPPTLADLLLEDIEWRKIRTILEPSVGKGDLLYAAGRAISEYRADLCCHVDAVEIDPVLRNFVKSEFSHEAERKWFHKWDELAFRRGQNNRHVILTAEENEEKNRCYTMYRTVKDLPLHVVGDDFLTFDTMKKYDLIMMNPPFHTGDAHLLKAIAMQERYGGQIRCILNAQTIRNPNTRQKQYLAEKLSQLGADISFHKEAFSDAERCTDVEVAVIKLDIPAPQMESEFFTRMHKAEAERIQSTEPTELLVADKVQAVLSQYRVEIASGIALIQEYNALRPYILRSFKDDAYPTLGITVDSDHCSLSSTPDVNKYIQAVRLKYWNHLCIHPDFVGQLTTNLQEELRSRVNELAEYEFDLFNIQTVLREMNARMEKGIIETILDLFEEMTVKHTWCEEYQKNTHYFNGWASNKAHKVNHKVILPCYGVFSSYSWEKGKFNGYAAYSKLEDMERTLNYLDGNMTAEVGLRGAMERAERTGITRNIQCKFFNVTFYKKGTMHIHFTCPKLLERFNIFCARERGWLPPSYGRKRYEDLDREEKTVIDSFHGNDTDGSGEASYEYVLRNTGYYLAPPNQQTLALPSTLSEEALSA